MEYRPVAAEDRSEILRLWSEAFSEDGSWFFAGVAADGWCADDGSGLRAMAFALPQTLVTAEGEYPVVYLYAVATQREYRAKGHATALFQRIEDDARRRGVAAMFLVPATPGLFRLYEKMGFRVWADRPAGKAEGSCRPCGETEYLTLRQTYLTPPYVRPDESVLRQYRLYRFDGGALATDRDGAVVERLPLREPSGVPFAMVKALTEPFPQKGYFAFPME